MEDDTMEIEQDTEVRLVDILDSDDSARISDSIKDILMQKSVGKVETTRQEVVGKMFDLEGNADES
tara:strand:- start:956 stop:1153 length:198 start_codon:yes stop_codon:yes gene_type:complete